ncbi:Alpha,alpha-trehalose-phosphate synthase [UDP-forming] [Hartmannibacter diazotrophicus]|uniref:Trehalose-6-phosphate synthase n=1 Tax=Hartmannibacter diazotrophicus TaxID=1482074 RepID=A0A2C9DBK6_9HYPH|nr:alpha,alpha-trehalose-phosphate synthase (UDP-forming) [Hartmannibacter diazotrophicus]SON57646.1 Alpha,alpha-trehalose-phosphate synthase [UDP-forming] [Hartmannibacter diazotrophicus]
MGKLIVVSNRVGPLKDTGKAGGLAVALVDVLRERGGVWFGWSGQVSEEGTFGEMKRQKSRNVELATVDMNKADYEEFYAGYANRTLWPILHYRLDLAEFDRPYEQGYRRVNERFATRLKPLIEPGDVVWVHDYHFFTLAGQLRAMGVECRIGFFLHIPFPSPDIITALPRHTALVRSMLAYDVIGFQSNRDRNHFIEYLIQEAGGERVGEDRVRAFGREVVVKAFPIGIDAEGFSQFPKSPEGRRQSQRIKAILGDRAQIVGVDRVDYSKGIPHRFRAFERLLEDYPENRGRVSLLQVAPPSRSELDAYVDIQRELEHLAGQINGRFADVDWTPIRFIMRGFPRKALAGLYRSSRIALVTPLRDGMNLVAKEYVAAQDPEDPGVLVLSRFAGAAEELNESVIVNPYDTEEVAGSLQMALQMPLDERKSRYEAMFNKIVTNDAKRWAESFLSYLSG